MTFRRIIRRILLSAFIIVLLSAIPLIPLYMILFQSLPHEKEFDTDSSVSSLLLFTGNYFARFYVKENGRMYYIDHDKFGVFIQVDDRCEKKEYPFQFSVDYPWRRVSIRLVPVGKQEKDMKIYYSITRRL
ncbi:MAG: hypothetical protein BWY31_02644 [Lentisphaerae bacterium ADurb.Bin242]|nr:MAG: hypothetical protein BWY31_02644 [Lentisphaerae bacterium ADurb.Bin242]